MIGEAKAEPNLVTINVIKWLMPWAGHIAQMVDKRWTSKVADRDQWMVVGLDKDGWRDGETNLMPSGSVALNEMLKTGCRGEAMPKPSCYR